MAQFRAVDLLARRFDALKVGERRARCIMAPAPREAG